MKALANARLMQSGLIDRESMVTKGKLYRQLFMRFRPLLMAAETLGRVRMTRNGAQTSPNDLGIETSKLTRTHDCRYGVSCQSAITASTKPTNR
jgi:hypothetical protein